MRKQIFLGVLSLTLAMVMGCATVETPVAAPIEEIEIEIETEVAAEEAVFVEVELPAVEPEPEEVIYGYVALTFDDGPVGNTETLLEGLAERNVKATFFCLGVQAAKYPDTVQHIVDEGHQLANHSYSHLNMTKVTQEQWQTDFQKTEDLFNDILGRDAETAYWLRPPYGLINRSQYSSVDVPMILWSVDPRDWESLDTQGVVDAVLSTVEPNDIILLHDTYATSVEAALQLIDEMTAMGYRFVTVEELLAINEIEAEASVIYRSATGYSDSIWYGSDYVKSQ